MDIKTHPVQTSRRGNARVPQVVTMRAYEVYCHLYGKQEALVTGVCRGGCRGGFSSGELMAFLYVYPFPKGEWSIRVQEAFKGMENL